MRSSETVLGMLQDRGKRGVPMQDLYRQLYNPQLYLRAYARLYSNDGAMTKGTTEETVDGMSLKKLFEIIELLKQEQFHWTPVRRTYIPKKNRKLRPLGLPTWTDKLVQEVLRSLLEAYYEPQFSEASHGFRPQRGCHTALSEIRAGWRGIHWFIEPDIKACFEQLNHSVLLDILAEKIHDNRFLRLIKQLLQAGYLEEWRYHDTYSGSPQGGVVSPILANIYLDKLDHYIEKELLPAYTRGEHRNVNPAYHRIQNRVVSFKKKGNYAQARQVKRLLRALPARDPNDPHFRRLKYVRYADDTLLGTALPKSEAEVIKRTLGNFLRHTLKLELSQEKTLITHAVTQPARFLGYDIIASVRNDRISARGQRDLNGNIRLRLPAEVVEKKRAQYKHKGKPLRRMRIASQTDYTILNTYQAEYRGLYQYYQLADNVCWLNRLHWDMQQSLLHTLAAKYRTSKQAMVHRYHAIIETPDGIRRCLRVTKERTGGKKPLIATFGGIALKHKEQAILIDRLPIPVRYEQKEVLRRLIASTCELCTIKSENAVVHQVRKLADLERMGKGRPYWAQIMLKRRRQTLVVCQACHHTIHQD
jgi:group II intron reverse transcriptase/maturase